MSDDNKVVDAAARMAHETISEARELALLRFVRTARASGYSMRVSLAAFRGAGGMIRTEDFLRHWEAADDA